MKCSKLVVIFEVDDMITQEKKQKKNGEGGG